MSGNLEMVKYLAKALSLGQSEVCNQLSVCMAAVVCRAPEKFLLALFELYIRPNAQQLKNSLFTLEAIQALCLQSYEIVLIKALQLFLADNSLEALLSTEMYQNEDSSSTTLFTCILTQRLHLVFHFLRVEAYAYTAMNCRTCLGVQVSFSLKEYPAAYIPPEFKKYKDQLDLTKQLFSLIQGASPYVSKIHKLCYFKTALCLCEQNIAKSPISR